MAQTVATQRGTGSASNNTITTLFTQSGGNATRVIFNQLAFYSNQLAGAFNYPTISIVHTVSNGSTNLIGWWKSGPSTVYGGQICPNPNGTSPMQTNGSASGTSFASNGGYLANNYTFNYPGSYGYFYIFGSADTNYGSYAPQNFWISSGDSVSLRFYDSNSNGLIYAYHFVTITES
jgi:hypothetical protein